jgi:LPS-assembly protein
LLWNAGFLKFAAAYKYTGYKLKDAPETVDTSPKRSVGMASVDGGLYFDRTLNLFGLDILQTLEPRIFYLYQGYEDQDLLPRFDSSALTFGYSQLYRDNRFTGLDRLGDANQVSVGVSTRFMGLSSGREYLRASVGRIQYFKDRRVSLNTALNSPDNPDNLTNASALAGELSAALGGKYRIGAALVWDTKNSEIDESNFYLQYKRGERRLLNLGYRSRDLATDISQLDVSAYWALGNRWSLIGRYNYDLEFNRTIETFGGLEYNDCCWRLRILARKYIDNPSNRSIEDLDTDKGIFFQVVFKGLAGFGGKIDNIMENGIRGFHRRQ